MRSTDSTTALADAPKASMDSPLSLRDEAVAIARATPVPLLGAGLAVLVAGYLLGGLATGLGRDPEFDLGGTVSSPTVATVLMLAFAAGLGWSLGGRGPRALALLALLVAVARLLRLPAGLGIGDHTSQGAAELIIAALLLASVVWWCHLGRGKLPSSELGTRLDRVARRVVMAIPFRAAAVALVSLLAVLYVVAAPTFLPGTANEATVDESTVFGWASGALLAAAAILALLLGRTPGATRWALVLAAALAYMAVDEPHALHERIGYRTSLSERMVVAPILIVAGLGWLGTLRVLPSRRATGLFVAGAALWLGDQILDSIGGPAPAVQRLLEEYFELAGSTCLLLALLLAVQSAQSPTAEGRIPAVAARERRVALSR